MKIVHVITRLIVGGAQENTLLSCEGQHDLGHDVTLITGPPLGPEGSLMERCTRFRLAWAHREDWAGILVVTHWGFIRGLTGRSVENGTLLAFDPTLA